MSAARMDQVREKLSKKLVSLLEWIETTPSDQKTVFLGPATEEAVQTHIKNIERSIKEVDPGTLGTCVVCEESVESERLEVDYTCCVCLDHFSVEEVRELEH